MLFTPDGPLLNSPWNPRPGSGLEGASSKGLHRQMLQRRTSKEIDMTTTVENQAVVPAVRKFLEKPKGLFVDGQWVDAVAGETFATHDPATGEQLCMVARGQAVD